VLDFDIVCPGCGEERTRCISGDELDLAYIEIEDS
jgi:Zn finger protein HypA/HybF involved in hydrogenase expression